MPPDASYIRGTKPCLYYKDLGENFLPAEDSKTIYNPERDESVIKELHVKRLVSTYQDSYCSAVGKKSLVIDPNDLEADQFMVYFNKYYASRSQAVLRPVETGRRLIGYTRFGNYYTGKTEYEETISREGYSYFRRDYERGKSRLFGKKQEALKKLKESQRDGEATGGQREARNGGDKEKQDGKVDKMKKEKGNNEALEIDRNEEKERGGSKEKICMLCCEKYGDFSPSVPPSCACETPGTAAAKTDCPLAESDH